MSGPDDPGTGGSRTTLRSGKKAELQSVIKERPYVKISASKPSTRSTTSLWLIEEPASLQFWLDQNDEDGKVLTPFPDMTGKQLPSLLDVRKHMAYLRHTMPKSSVYDLAIHVTLSLYTGGWLRNLCRSFLTARRRPTVQLTGSPNSGRNIRL